MKHAILPLLAFLSFAQFSLSQSVTDFVNFDNQWNLLTSDNGGSAFTTKYRFDEDSILVKNLTYFTMEYSEEELGTEWISYNEAAYRQEEKKVYQLNLFDSIEMLLYDFGLEVGDVLLGTDYIGEPDLTVVEIDSLQLEDGSFRKQLHMSSGNSCTVPWVEGLGSINYAFNSVMYTCFADIGTTLICFSQNNSPLFYDNEDFFGCWYESEPPSTPCLINYGSQWNLLFSSQFNGNQSTTKLRFNTIPKGYNNNDYTYYLMERSSEENGMDWTLIESQAYREEEEKVFLYNTADSVEVLIYDFNLEVGDTFISKESPSAEGVEMTVTAVDSIQLLDGSYRKRIELDCGSNFTIEWVKGIGNIDYPLSGTIYSCFFDVPGRLLCYYSGTNPVYEGVNSVEGCWLVDVEEIPQEEINVYPNPITDRISIEAETPIVLVKLYNIQGQLILESKDSDNIIVDKLNGGMYILHLVNNKGQELSKRIVIK